MADEEEGVAKLDVIRLGQYWETTASDLTALHLLFLAVLRSLNISLNLAKGDQSQPSEVSWRTKAKMILRVA